MHVVAFNQQSLLPLGRTARRQVCERAHGGTLFLDEIGEASGGFQGSFWGCRQGAHAGASGGAEEREVDLRLVAATTSDRRVEVEASRFREDQYFRLAGIPIYLLLT